MSGEEQAVLVHVALPAADVVDLRSLPPGSPAEKRYGGPGARVVRVG